MYLKLIRTEPKQKAVFGQLIEINHLTGNKVLCDTLENKECLIPELIYRVDVTQSPKFGRLLPLICAVPGRSGIRMHAGNVAGDSSGCVLVGEKEGRRLLNSRNTERVITDYLKGVKNSHEEIRIEITHEMPEYPGYGVDYGGGGDMYAIVCEPSGGGDE